jgi:hypothetical protein
MGRKNKIRTLVKAIENDPHRRNKKAAICKMVNRAARGSIPTSEHTTREQIVKRMKEKTNDPHIINF